jgi:hypothetical protein
MERLAALVVVGLRVRVTIDNLQCPLSILELYLYDLLLMQVHLLFALPLAEKRTVLALLLHLIVELPHKPWWRELELRDMWRL